MNKFHDGISKNQSFSNLIFILFCLFILFLKQHLHPEHDKMNKL